MKPTLALAALLAIGPLDAGHYRPRIGGAMFAETQNRPGDISEAHFLIDNRGERQAVPVRIHQPPEDHAVRTEIANPVTLAPSTVVAARAARTVWEYRTETIP